MPNEIVTGIRTIRSRKQRHTHIGKYQRMQLYPGFGHYSIIGFSSTFPLPSRWTGNEGWRGWWDAAQRWREQSNPNPSEHRTYISSINTIEHASGGFWQAGHQLWKAFNAIKLFAICAYISEGRYYSNLEW